MTKLTRNIIHIILLIILSGVLYSINPKVAESSILQFEKLFELNLILLGVGISLITFLYTILINLKAELAREFGNVYDSDFYTILKSINLNVKRILVSFFIIVIIIMIKDFDFPIIYLLGLKESTLAIIRISLLLYIIASITDIILSTLRLYEIAFKISK